MFSVDRRVLIHFDIFVVLMILPLCFGSLYLISEINTTLAKKEVFYIIVGFCLFLFFTVMPIRKLLWIIPIVYWLDILLLISVKIFGVSVLGAKRWLEIPFTTMTIQPSELIKPALLMMLALLIQKDPPPKEGYDLHQFAKIAGYIMLPFCLIAIEPDLGSAMVVLLLGFGVLFTIGVRWKIWVVLALVVSLGSTFLYGGLKDYQKQRIKDFIGDKPSYHVQQSIIAIGSGGIIGKSKDDATQVQLKFLPIATTDFIFAYYCEIFGFIGAFSLISLYALIILHVFFMRHKFKNDYFGIVFATGVSVLFFIYSSINMAMTTGLAPVVGIPLPMFSYGGTSFITFMILLGVLENLLAFRFNFLYNSVSFSRKQSIELPKLDKKKGS